MFKNKNHPFHMVTPSPWPFLTSISSLSLVFSIISYLHLNSYCFYFILALVNLLINMGFWWRDVIREATFQGAHSSFAQTGIKIGMILFIVSEIMFFFSLFWAFFHSSLAPTYQIGCVWPPEGIIAPNPFGIPLVNTYTLLLSGATITYTHYFMRLGLLEVIFEGFFFTILLALFFTGLQVYEYRNLSFTISDGIYGSVFYMITGFHGIHVIIGTIFIIVCFIRTIFRHFTKNQHLGFELAIWYWHFVDIIWIFVFIFIYWWGGLHYYV